MHGHLNVKIAFQFSAKKFYCVYLLAKHRVIESINILISRDIISGYLSKT